MRYLTIIVFVLMLNLSFTAIDVLGLNFATRNVVLSPYSSINTLGGDTVTNNGVIQCSSVNQQNSLACKAESFTKTETLRKSGGVSAQAVQVGDNDFLRAISMFVDIFVNAIYSPGSVYSKFFGSSAFGGEDVVAGKARMLNVVFLINTPMYLLYAFAIIQLLSGRSFKDLS